jgi:uncharacterized hydrophobic protein (TIGR00271 family)
MENMKITRESLEASSRILVNRAKLDIDFVLLTAGAAAICSFGFRMNSPAVIVGAMVISPLLYAVVSVGVASFRKDWKIVTQGISTLALGMVSAGGMAVSINLFFQTDHRSEIVERLSSSPVDYFFVALFSGLVGTFAFFWPDIIEALAGIAISVALIPPIVLVGIGIANAEYSLIVGSLTIVCVNIVGIYLGAFLMFAGLHFFSRTAHQE